MKGQRLAFIGAGNMASNLIAGLINDGFNPSHIVASSPDADKLAEFGQRLKINTTINNSEAVSGVDVVVLCVKPRLIPIVVKEIALVLAAQKPLIISIAAGIAAKQISENLDFDAAVVRAMPNIAAMVRSAATALYANKSTTEAQRELAESIMRSVGLAVWVDDETKMDAITALSGSGPAYFFLLIEAMQEAAQKLGLSENESTLLSLQTALGAARMALESPESVIVLREQVTSPGGTTEQAIKTLESGSLRKLVLDAMSAAMLRAKELSKG